MACGGVMEFWITFGVSLSFYLVGLLSGCLASSASRRRGRR